MTPKADKLIGACAAPSTTPGQSARLEGRRFALPQLGQPHQLVVELDGIVWPRSLVQIGRGIECPPQAFPVTGHSGMMADIRIMRAYLDDSDTMTFSRDLKLEVR